MATHSLHGLARRASRGKLMLLLHGRRVFMRQGIRVFSVSTHPSNHLIAPTEVAQRRYEL